jgi:hypothetical protein
MTKIKLTTSFRILIIYLLVVIALCLAASCSPVKQVLKDESKMREVWEKGVLKSWCVNDTLILNQSDTLITFDTLFALDYRTDTYTVDNEIVKTVYKTVVKTVAIRDTFTAVVKDWKHIELIQKQLIAKDGQLLEKIDQLEKSKSETKQARKDRNKWRLWFFILLGIIGVYLFRKPLRFLVNRVSPIKI